MPMPLHRQATPPWIISNDAAAIGGATSTTLVAEAVYLYAFEIDSTITITGGKWRTGTTAAGTCDVGVYDMNGNLLGHTGQVSNIVSTNMSAALLVNVTLSPGQYFMALWASVATDDYLGISSTGTFASESRNRIATNATSATGLPATTGGYADNPTRIPAMSLTIAGGLT